MNGSWQCFGASNRHVASGGAAMFGESMWKIRAKSASLRFDHTGLAELIARRWNQDRQYFAPRMTRRWRVPEGLVVAATGSQCLEVVANSPAPALRAKT